MNRPILVFGANGQLGRELIALAAERGTAALGVARADGDIADGERVAHLIATEQPRLVVNAAAYTAVDKAESEPDAARRGNVEGPRTLARETAKAGLPLIHVSTDYVFDGSKSGAYDEGDPLSPLGVYGETKAAGEDAVRAENPRHVIVRTAWVYGRHGNNFLKTMLRLACERDRLRVVADQRGCPTATADLAEALLAIDRTLLDDRSASGTFHFAGTGATTWHGFASAIVAEQAAITGRPAPIVDAITTADFPTPARRPANSELDSSRFVERFGYQAQSWQQRTRDVVFALTRAA